MKISTVDENRTNTTDGTRKTCEIVNQGVSIIENSFIDEVNTDAELLTRIAKINSGNQMIIIQEETEHYTEQENHFKKRTAEINDDNERLKVELHDKEAILMKLMKENEMLKELEHRYETQLTLIAKTRERTNVKSRNDVDNELNVKGMPSDNPLQSSHHIRKRPRLTACNED